MTAEHVFPQWLSRWLQDQGVEKFELRSSHHGNRSSELLDIKVKRFCENCNSIWMGEMETAVKPVLTTMIRDITQRTISQEDQISLARWGFKTMLTLLAAQPSDRIPPLDIYRGFRRWQTPPTNLWLGSAPDDYVRFDLKLITHDGTGTDFYQLMLQIGRVFIGSIYSMNPELAIDPAGLDIERYRSIWPPMHPVDWPPPQTIDPMTLFPALKSK